MSYYLTLIHPPKNCRALLTSKTHKTKVLTDVEPEARTDTVTGIETEAVIEIVNNFEVELKE